MAAVPALSAVCTAAGSPVLRGRCLVAPAQTGQGCGRGAGGQELHGQVPQPHAHQHRQQPRQHANEQHRPRSVERTHVKVDGGRQLLGGGEAVARVGHGHEGQVRGCDARSEGHEEAGVVPRHRRQAAKVVRYEQCLCRHRELVSATWPGHGGVKICCEGGARRHGGKQQRRGQDECEEEREAQLRVHRHRHRPAAQGLMAQI